METNNKQNNDLANADDYIDYYDSHVYLETGLMYHRLNEYYKDFIKRKYNIIKKEK